MADLAPPAYRQPPPKKTTVIHHSSTDAVVVATPAVRLVIVNVVADPVGGTIVEFVPVVGIETRIDDHYRATVPTGEGCSVGPTHQIMANCGWFFEGRETTRSAIVVGGEFGELEPAETAFNSSNEAWQLTAAPWPETEDAKKLKDVVERVKLKAIKNAEASRA